MVALLTFIPVVSITTPVFDTYAAVNALVALDAVPKNKLAVITLQLIFPTTSNLFTGEIVPMPTLPLFNIVIAILLCGAK